MSDKCGYIPLPHWNHLDIRPIVVSPGLITYLDGDGKVIEIDGELGVYIREAQIYMATLFMREYVQTGPWAAMLAEVRRACAPSFSVFSRTIINNASKAYGIPMSVLVAPWRVK